MASFLPAFARKEEISLGRADRFLEYPSKVFARLFHCVNGRQNPGLGLNEKILICKGHIKQYN